MIKEQRRLAAILAADVAGYSKLMAADEAGTLARLRQFRADLIEPKIAQFHGRIVGSAGDSLLVEFASAVSAVQCAVEVQEGLAGQNGSVAEGQRMVFRIGVNLGDVIPEGDTIHGDGVNIAARLEKLAEPGSVCIGRNVYDQVKSKLAYSYADLGEQILHNIAEPVRAYQIGPADDVAGASVGVKEPHRSSERISVAVLPFVNMSRDPDQEYFADGITQDIITDLSRWPSLAVRSRDSTIRYKGQPTDRQRISRELGTRFLVEGSVRRMGERIRITAQLTDAESGNHIWAERFDRPTADFFALQDEVVRTIVGTLVGRVYAGGVEYARRKPPSSLAAYDHVMRGNALPWDDPVSAAEAKRSFERAIELDPEYGLPYALLATMLLREWICDFFDSQETLDRAFTLARRAVELAENESTCHAILGCAYHEKKSFEMALRHFERAVEINPNNQWCQADLGIFLAHIGRAEEGLETLQKAPRVDPYFGPPWYWRGLGLTFFVLRRYEEALANFDRGASSSARWDLAVMAGCCAKLGDLKRAQDLVARCLAGQPEASVKKVIAKIPFKHASDTQHLAECLRVAGMPD